MRDPLARVPIRYKLTFGFVGLCLLAYGVGAFLVSSSARDALREQIEQRLRSASHARAVVLDEGLRTLTFRARDFASDGMIRSESERLSALAGDPAGPEAAALKKHLAENKLPIVAAFVDLVVCAEDGRRLAEVRDALPLGAEAMVAESVRHDDTWVGGFEPPLVPGGAPCFGLSTPLWSVDRSRRVGRLVCWVDAERWLETVPVEAPDEHPEDMTATVSARGGGAVVLLPAAPGAKKRVVAVGAAGERPPRDREEEQIKDTWPLSTADWTVGVAMGTARAFEPVAGLQSRFLGAGLLIAAATAFLLFFPLRFLVKPLGALRDAAKRISEGDLTQRVTIESQDEVGDLARAFNLMAEAVRDRTRRLEETARDLEARKDDLARERDRLDAMVHSMQDALLFFDDRGRVMLSNAAAAPLLPVLSGPAGVDLAVRCGAGEERHPRDCVSCLAQGDLPKQSCRLEVGNRVYEVLATRIPSVSGWLGRLLVARDITDLVTLDERQARQERLAVLGEVAAVVAHELNNPLSAIAMYAQMMDEELPADSPFREHVSVVRRNTETCTKTIRGLLDWAWSAEPEVADVDVTEVLDEVGRFLKPLLARGGVSLVRKDGLNDPVLRADGIQVRQALVNLTLNAIQAVEGVGTKVEIATSEADGGRTLQIDVSDDGPGIAPERRDRIFEPFFTTKVAGKGTGLGLTISRRIVEAHGGTLSLVTADPGRTTFRVRLPRSAMVVTRRAAPASTPAAGAS